MGEHSPRRGERPSRPNIVLVSVDSLRADHCGHLGSEFDLTPTLDALASEGVAFENAVAPGPQTFSSMPVAFTGQHRSPEPSDGDGSHWQRRLGAIDDHLDRHPTIPERLSALGYETGAISPNPWTSSVAGFDRGFDQFIDRSGKDEAGVLDRIAGAIPRVDADSRRVELLGNMLSGSSFFNRWESLYDDLDRLRRRLAEPYFLWVFLLDTHYPFVTGRAHREEGSLLGMYRSNYRSEGAMRGNADTMPRAVRESICRSYRDTVRAVDAFLERFLSDAAADDPALIVHADHGESLGDHGNYGHHHRQLYEENIHVPYVLANAGQRERVREPTTLRSIHDLTLDVATAGAVDTDAVTAPRVVASSVSGNSRAVRERAFKYVERDGTERLFDLRSDPGERTDVAGEFPDRLDACRDRLESYDRHLTELTGLYAATDAIAGDKLL